MKQHQPLHGLKMGWCTLAFWASMGLGLEAAHAFKWAPLMEDAWALTLGRLAHAHGSGLALAFLVWCVAARPYLEPPRARAITGRFFAAIWFIPVGFGGSIWGHSESDPGLLILAVPIGGVLLVWTLITTARELGPTRRDRQ